MDTVDCPAAIAHPVVLGKPLAVNQGETVHTNNMNY